MKFKKIIFFIIAFCLLSITITINVDSSNIPVYDENTDNPGAGSGLSAPSTKFDVFENNSVEQINYANHKIINLNISEEKTFTLNFYTIQWYASYPVQELVLNSENKNIVDVNYYRNGTISGVVDDSSTNKKITDSTLPERLIGGKLNQDFPSLEFKLTGVSEGISYLDIAINSTHEYGLNRNTTETLRILINVSSTSLIEIPNYVEAIVGTGIHSGTRNVRYYENESIGLLSDVVNSITISVPSEIEAYNETKSSKISHKILTDNSIAVSDDVLSFGGSSNVGNFTIAYYIQTNNGEEVLITTYSFVLVSYSKDDIIIEYNYSDFPEDGVYEVGKPITIETNESLKPYIENLVIAYENQLDMILCEIPYIIKEPTEEKHIIIADKLIALSGLLNYSGDKYKFLELFLAPDNVIEKQYPTKIELEDEYRYNFEGEFETYLEIKNIHDFDVDTSFTIRTSELLEVSFTSDKKIRLYFANKEKLLSVLHTSITVEAELGNGIILTKEVNIYLVPVDGYRYTFNATRITVTEGGKQVITLGILNPDFTPVADVMIERFYQKTGNCLVDNDVTEINKFIITGFIAGTDVIYFAIEDQIIEVEVTITRPDEQKTVQVNFNEGANLSILSTNSKTTITLPKEVENLTFKFIVSDGSVVELENTLSTKTDIKALKEGETQIFAFAQIDGSYYIAVINIRVIEKLPTVTIVYDKEDSLTSLTKYDDIKVSFNASDFDFSKNTTYSWYLNDELIYENIKSFERTFDEGSNILKLIIKDLDNNIEIETTQQIIISSVENTERTISINANKTIYVDLSQGEFEIEALLDGVLNPNYKYYWSVANSSVCKIRINGNERIVLEATSLGETDLTVMTDISKYEEVFIKAEIKIIVIEPTYKIINNSFIKPGSNQLIKIVGDDKTIYNLKPIINITLDGEKFENFEVDKNEIVIHNIQRGKYKIKVDLTGKTVSTEFDATNFNIKEIAIVILPYLFVACVIILGIVFAIKKGKSQLERTESRIVKLDEMAVNILNKKEFNKKAINEMLKKTIKIKKMVVYSIDEGVDELSTIVPPLDDLIKVLIATINSDVGDEKIGIIVKNVKRMTIEKILKNFNIIKNERTEFENTKKAEDESPTKKQKKAKITKEEYEEYLAHSKYVDADEED